MWFTHIFFIHSLFFFISSYNASFENNSIIDGVVWYSVVYWGWLESRSHSTYENWFNFEIMPNPLQKKDVISDLFF